MNRGRLFVRKAQRFLDEQVFPRLEGGNRDFRLGITVTEKNGVDVWSIDHFPVVCCMTCDVESIRQVPGESGGNVAGPRDLKEMLKLVEVGHVLDLCDRTAADDGDPYSFHTDSDLEWRWTHGRHSSIVFRAGSRRGG